MLNGKLNIANSDKAIDYTPPKEGDIVDKNKKINSGELSLFSAGGAVGKNDKAFGMPLSIESGGSAFELWKKTEENVQLKANVTQNVQKPKTKGDCKKEGFSNAKSLNKLSKKYMAAVGETDFQNSLSKINADNVIETIRAYDKISPEETVLEMICDEKGSSDQERQEALIKIFNKLVEKGKNIGMEKAALQTYSNEFKSTVRMEFKKIGFIDTEAMEKVMYALVQAVENRSILSPKEISQIKSQGGKEQISQTTTFLSRKAISAEKSFQSQKDYDGWAGRAVDKMSSLWNSDNRASLVESDIKKYKAQIGQLSVAAKAGKAQFENEFYKTFGIDFDPIQMAAYEKKEAQYSLASACYGVESQFKSQMGKLISSPQLRNEERCDITPDGIPVTQVLATKATVYSREVGQFAQFIGQGDSVKGHKQIAEALKASGLDPKTAKIEDKYRVISGFAKKYSEALHKNTLKVTDGKGYGAVSKEFDSSYNATFGTKNDIAQRVSKYNASQEQGAVLLKGAIVTVGSTLIGVATGGVSLIPTLVAAGSTTVLSAGVGLSDRMTSKNGLQKSEFNQIVKSAVIDGATILASGGVALGAKAAHASRVVERVVRTSADTGIDMAAEYLQTGGVTLESTLISAGASFIGQTIEGAIDNKNLKKEFDLGDIDERALDNYTQNALSEQREQHSIRYDDLNVNRPGEAANYFSSQKKFKTSVGLTLEAVTNDNKLFNVKHQTNIEPKQMIKIKEQLDYDLKAINVDLADVERRINLLSDASQRAELMELLNKRKISLATDFNVGKNSKIIGETTGDATNDWWKAKGYELPPYLPGSSKVEIIKLEADTKFVRVFDDETSFMAGGWIMKASDVKGLSPQQIKDKFALPSLPKFVAEGTFTAGTELRTGLCNPLEGWGNGGGVQYDLMGVRTGKFGTPRKF